MAYIGMACKVMARGLRRPASRPVCGHGLYIYDLYSYGLYSYGQYSYGLYIYDLYSYGLRPAVSCQPAGMGHIQLTGRYYRDSDPKCFNINSVTASSAPAARCRVRPE